MTFEHATLTGAGSPEGARDCRRARFRLLRECGLRERFNDHSWPLFRQIVEACIEGRSEPERSELRRLLETAG